MPHYITPPLPPTPALSFFVYFPRIHEYEEQKLQFKTIKVVRVDFFFSEWPEKVCLSGPRDVIQTNTRTYIACMVFFPFKYLKR